MTDPKADIDNLVNNACGLGFAVEMLLQHGTFRPYGAALKPNGEIVSVSLPSKSEEPASQAMIDLLKDRLRKSVPTGKYKATAIFYNVEVALPDGSGISDAIAASLDHRDDYSVVVLYPYRVEGNRIHHGPMFEQTGGNDIFKQPAVAS